MVEPETQTRWRHFWCMFLQFEDTCLYAVAGRLQNLQPMWTRSQDNLTSPHLPDSAIVTPQTCVWLVHLWVWSSLSVPSHAGKAEFFYPPPFTTWPAPMSYPWFGAPNSVPGLDNAAQNGSLTHSPAALGGGGGTDSPGTSAHHAGAASGFPSTSPYSGLTATSQHSSESHSQSPHGLSQPTPSSFLSSFAENSLQQHLYSAPNRFGPFSSDGVSSSDQGYPFGMPHQMLSQQYTMRSQAYPGMSGYTDSSQQDMSRLSAYSASPYGAPGFDNYYSPFDSRSVPGASQSGESVFGAADRLMKPDTYENGIPRAPTNAWQQFGADGREGLYLQSGYTPHPMASYGGPLSPMFHPNSAYRTMGYDGPFKPDMSDPYGLASSAMGPRFSPPQMMFNRDKKSPKKPDSSPIPKPATNVDDSPPVPNKAAKYFSERGIFVFHPPDTGPAMGPYGSMMISISDRYIMCQKMLCQRLSDVDLPPKVTYVYNPLEYAFETHYKFVKKFYNSHKRVLFLGMNPGPFGMSQNGVSGEYMWRKRERSVCVMSLFLWLWMWLVCMCVCVCR